MITTPRELFDYQSHTVDTLIPDAIRRGSRRIGVVACCGAGKTDIIAETCRRAASKGNTVTVTAHRRRLIQQLSERMQLYGIRYSVEMADLPDEPWVAKDAGADIVIGSAHTMASRLDTSGVRRSKILIPDEAHTINTKMYKSVIDAVGAEYLFGPTATPCQEDGSGFGRNVFHELVTVTTIQELLARTPPRLVHTKAYAPVGAGKRRRKGLKTGVSGDPVAHWIKFGYDLRTITFCRTLDECRAVRDMFIADGIAAVHIDAHTPSEERNEAIRQLRTGEIKVLVCTPSLLGVGTDIPEVECIQLLTKNESPRAHWQLLGRGQRASEGKKELILLDHAAAVFVHGHPDQSPVWALSENDSVQRKTAERMAADPQDYKPATCPACGCMSVGSRQCPGCSAQIYRESKKDVGTEREALQAVGGEHGEVSGPNPVWQKAWRGILYSAGAQGLSLAAASMRFKGKYGVFPEQAGVHPVASFDDRKKKIGEVFPQFVKSKAA